ncbi:MAG: hypothetical protein MZV63_22515 [Marinilabiliales bacterium]|nr:hypothetical protein [Marinilabiliales bacterium]
MTSRNAGITSGEWLTGPFKHNVRLRPHFKTHQSRQIAGWFREAGHQLHHGLLPEDG